MVSGAPLLARPPLGGGAIVTARTSNVPARVTPLVGRVGELAELARLVPGERVLTLTGSGGCGKTRLALELVERIADRFTGGVAWVELASCSDVDGLLCSLAGALDVVELHGEAMLDGVLRVLRSRASVLVVLDNAEHLLGPVAEVVAALAAGVAHVTVVCTSREPIGAAGEVVWRVPSLGTPVVGAGAVTTADLERSDAALLFIERARRARRGFQPSDTNAAAIAQICVRLDGVPLAIELAAARVRSMPPERIATQLDDRFRLLAGGPRTVLARQQTLHASVAWSEALLDATERAVFRRLGVFSGGFTVDAAEQVVGAFDDVDVYDVAEVVSRLVDKSLVQFDEPNDRYSLLDTIRSYALQRLLDCDETAHARDAHAEWCAAWLLSAASEENVADVNEWWESRLGIVGRVDPEWANCASALEWAPPGSTLSLRLVAGLGDYWALRQRANDSARYGMPAVIAASTDDPAWLPAIVALQTVRTNAADAEFATLRDVAAVMAAERGDRRASIRLEVSRHIAMVMLFGPRADLIAAIDTVRTDAREVGEWYTAWNATQSPAVMLVASGRPREAEERVAGLSSARALLIRAAAAQMRGDMVVSDELAAQAQSMLDARLGAAMDRIIVAFRAAGAALAVADRSIIEDLRLVEVSTESLPRPFVSAYAMTHGVEELLHGRLDSARSIFGGAQPDLFTSWRSVCFLAQIEMALGDVAAARITAQGLRDVAEASAAPLYLATAELVLAECERADDVNAALDLAHRSLTTAAESELWLVVVDALEAVGSMLLDVGRDRDAARLMAAAQAARGSMPYRYRFAHRAAYVAAAHDRVVGADGWSEGAGLTLPGAVEVAQRMRGERVRPLAGWESLTPTERRVVEQVANGLSNPQIAAALLMSRATVKTHLVHVYAKLGFSNRAELAAGVARRELP